MAWFLVNHGNLSFTPSYTHSPLQNYLFHSFLLTYFIVSSIHPHHLPWFWSSSRNFKVPQPDTLYHFLTTPACPSLFRALITYFSSLVYLFSLACFCLSPLTTLHPCCYCWAHVLYRTYNCGSFQGPESHMAPHPPPINWFANVSYLNQLNHQTCFPC